MHMHHDTVKLRCAIEWHRWEGCTEWSVCVRVQLVWVCLHGTDYGLPRHIILLLRLARMRRVFTLIKVGTAGLS